MKRVFKTDLSRSGIADLRKQLVDYKNNVLQQKVDLLAKRLAEKGVAIAQTNIATYDAIFTGELISSIEARYGGSTKGSAVFYVAVRVSEFFCGSRKTKTRTFSNGDFRSYQYGFRLVVYGGI